MDPQIQQLLQQLDQMMTSTGGALTATNDQAFQQAVREFNLNYTNAVAGQYGYNTGVGMPGPPFEPTLAAQEQLGSIGYIPGLSGGGDAQSLSAMNQLMQLSQQNANNTGFYNTPMNSPYTPGTFLNIDPSTYPASQGTQMDYVLPSGQLQRVTPAQAQAMGFKGQTTGTISIQQALGLEQAPPSSIPQETLQALGVYSNLNQQAQSQAAQQAQLTGMYTQPGQITAPGTNMSGATFGQLDPTIQQQYYQAHGGDWGAAMQAWVNDTNKAIMQANPNAQSVQSAGKPQETQQAQQQYFNQAEQLANQFGQYYAPGAPGQQGVAGVNNPNVGQITEQGREFNVNTASDLAKLASTLTGPADYFKYLQALNGGNSILRNLYTGAGQAPGGQVGSTGGSQSLDNILGQFGLSSGQLTGGTLPAGTYPSISSQGGGQGGTSQASSLNLPPPNQIQPSAYNSMSPSAQQFVQGAYQAAGYNPQDLNWFMNAATPAATSTSTGVAGGGTAGTSTHFANPSTQSLFA